MSVACTGPAVTTSQSERNLAVASHLLALLGWGVPGLNLVGPVAIWLFKGKTAPFVSEHARESINFQITLALVESVALLLAILVVIALSANLFAVASLAIGAGIYGMIFVLLAARSAAAGTVYRYPLTIRFFQ